MYTFNNLHNTPRVGTHGGSYPSSMKSKPAFNNFARLAEREREGSENRPPTNYDNNFGDYHTQSRIPGLSSHSKQISKQPRLERPTPDRYSQNIDVTPQIKPREQFRPQREERPQHEERPQREERPPSPPQNQPQEEGKDVDPSKLKCKHSNQSTPKITFFSHPWIPCLP